MLNRNEQRDIDREREREKPPTNIEMKGKMNFLNHSAYKKMKTYINLPTRDGGQPYSLLHT